MGKVCGVVVVWLCLLKDVLGQSGLCASGVPFFAVNLSGQPNGTYISPSIARDKHCCTAVNPDKCIEFQITLDPSAVAINFEIYSGAQPPGALYYQINCGPMVPIGQQICVSGVGPHTLTFCKPGNNKNQYRITSIQGYTNSANVNTIEDCHTALHVTGLVNSTIVWNDITGGGYYEGFLSCTTGCSDPLFTTGSGFPPYVDFEVCGKIYSSVCQSIMQTICDTVRVNIEQAMDISFTPEPAAFCEEDSSRLMTVTILPRKSTYNISWMSGPGGTGSVLGNDTFYYAQSAGNYSLVVVDTEFSLCSADTVDIPIAFIPSPSIITVPNSASICKGESVILTASGAVIYSWNPASTLSCGNCVSPTASPVVSTTYIITGTDSFGCSAKDTSTITVIQPVYSSLNFSICEGDFVMVGTSLYTNAGTYHDTVTSFSGCDSIITSTVQIRYNSFTLIDTVICNGTSMIVGSSTYSTPGTYFDTLAALNGCDSIIETHLAVHPLGICDNPDMTACPQRIVFVLDESGSVAGTSGGGSVNISAQVRSAAQGMINSINGTGAQVAVVEFNSTARRANIGGSTGYRIVDGTYTTEFSSYIAQDANTTGSANNYDPEDYPCLVPQSCYGNWEDAFEEVQSINSSLGLADLVIFFTDKQPTAYNNSWGGVTVGTGAAAVNQAVLEAAGMANAVQMQGSHVFVVGLPNATLPENYVQLVSGLERYPNQQQNFLKGDYLMTSSAQLVNSMTSIGLLICRADLSLIKTVNTMTVCEGSNVIFTLIVTNNGTVDASSITAKDYLPNGYTYVSDDGGIMTSVSGSTITWIVGSLANGQSDTLRITTTVNASGNHNNIAEITASDKADGDSTPNNDDGDQSEDDEDAVTVSILNCDDSNLCTTDVCTSGSCTHTYIPASCSISGNNSICSGETTQFTASGGITYSWSGPSGFTHIGANTGVVSNAGTYSVTVTNANGCTNTCSIMLTVKSLPSCNITGDNAICPGETSVFTASGGVAYSWSGPAGFTANTSVISGLSVTGNYFVSVTGANGCTSTCSISLAQLTPSFTVINDTICSGVTYLFASKSYTVSGTYYDTLTAMNGCDSVLRLNLYVIPLSYGPIDFTICQGDSVVIGNSVYYSSGIYYDTLVSSRGCDSIAISNIQVLNHSQVVNDITICTGESYAVGSSNYNNSGVYFDTITAVNGCDSIIQTNLVVLLVSSTVIDTVICANESFVVGTLSYTTAGTYYDTLTSANGCDSTIQTNLQVLPVPLTSIDTSICFGETYSFGSANYGSSGTYIDTFISINGCDSIVTLNLQVLPLSYGPFNYTICQGDSVVIGSSVYSSAGTYNDTFTSSNGCDSIVISSIQVLNHSQVINDITICTSESYTVGSSTYNSSGVYFDTLIASNSCDSIIQTNLLVLPTSFTLIDTAICSDENFPVGASSYSVAGIYFDTMVAYNGCDSVIQTNLQVMPVSITIIDTMVCPGEIFSVGSSNYAVNGTYADTLVSAYGCDSVVNLYLQILPLTYGPFNYAFCQGDSIVVGNSVYRNSGTFNDTFTSSRGCDSIVITSVQVFNDTLTLNDIIICDGEMTIVGSSSYNATGIYFDTLPSAIGCDSIIQTNLLVLPISYTLIDTTICMGEIFFVGTSGYAATGSYFDTLVSSYGCDSIVQTALVILPVPITVIDTMICPGETISVGFSVYSTSGNYSDTLVSANGCDSIVNLNLQVPPLTYGPFSYSFCQGDSVVIGNSVYKNSGTFNDTFTSSNGCDSIAISTIQVLNHSQTILNFTICSGNSIVVGSSTYFSPGIYFDTLLAANGCDSIIQTNLVVLPVSSSVIDTSICWGEFFVVGTSSYLTTGTYSDTLVAANGCDSIVQTNLQVLPISITSIDTAICSGETFLLGTSSYNTSGNYSDTVVSANGCDSIVNLNLTVLPLAYGPFSYTICQGDSIVIGSSIYKNSGTFNDTFTALNGCDSIVISTIQVLNHSQAILNFTICDGNSISVGSSIYSTTGVYFDTLSAANGCDSTIQTNLVILPISSSVVDASICSGEIFIVGISSYSVPGTYFDTLVSANSCDSIVQTNLQILPVAITTIDATICSGETFLLGTSNYGASGNYFDTFVGSNGCDSIVNLNLTVLPLTYSPFNYTICNGDSIVVGSSVYKNTGTFNDTFTSSNGCDSIVISTIQVLNHSQAILNFAVCNGDSIMVGSSTYSASGIYFDTLVAANSCDSIIQTNLLVLQNSSSVIDTSICSGEIFIVGTSGYSVPGTYFDTLVSANGCDSIIQTNLQVLPVSVTTIDTSICSGETFSLGTSNYSTSGNYSDTFVGFNGCDSIVNLNLTVLPLAYGPFSYTLCSGDSIVVGSSVYKNSGTFNDTFTALNGCDSIAISTIQVLNHSQAILNFTVCNGDSIVVGSSTYFNAGVYFDTLPAANGCDSIIQTNLVVLPVSSSVIDTSICWGEFFVVGTSSYSTTGTFFDTLVSANGCDSIVQTNLQVLPVAVTTIDTAICSGETFLLGTSNYSTSGNYSDTFVASNGCDSIVNLNLTVLPLAYGMFSYTLCQGDSIVIGSSVYKNSGTFNDTFMSANGCDSIVISTIQVLNHSQAILNFTVCSGNSIVVGSSTYFNAGVYFDTLPAANGCDSIIQTNLVVLPVSGSVNDTSICWGEFFVVGTSRYSTTGTFFDTLVAANGCDSIVQTNLQVLPISITSIDTAICSGETFSLGTANYSTSGNYSDTFISANGCDSIVNLNLTVLPLAYGSLSYTMCLGDSIIVGSSVYKNSGTFNDTFTSSNGCDSIVISTIQVLNHSQAILNFTVCNGDNIVVGSSTYFTTGIYFDTLIAANGCDSIVQTNLLVLPTSATVINTAICAGEIFVVGTSSYVSAGIYYDTLIAANGCDSVIHTNLSVLPVHITVIDTSICFGEIFSIGTNFYGSAGTYNDTFISANGCDSIVTTNLQVLPMAYGAFSINLCAGDSIVVGNSIYKTPGIYLDTLVSSFGCDSIVQSSITVINPKTSIISVTRCEGLTFVVGASVYSSSGTYFDTLIAASGCDSIVETHLLILKKSYKALTAEICQGQIFRVGSHSHTTTGVYFDTLRAANGCDSIVITNLKVYPTKFSTIVIGICQGDSLVFGNSVYRRTGNYSKTFKTFHGCDSIVQLQLQVWPEIHGAQDRLICEGDNIQFNLLGGIQYTWSPATFLSCSNCSNPTAAPPDDISYSIRVSDLHGCIGNDTIHVDVSHIELETDVSDQEVCEGDAVSFTEIYNSDYPLSNQMWDFGDGFFTINQNPVYGYFQDGVYSPNLTVTNSAGCTAIDNTSVTVHPRPDITLNADTAICFGDSMQLQASGADSFVWLPVDYLNNPDIANPIAKPDSDIQYYVIGLSSNGCLNHETIDITVRPLPDLHVSPDFSICPNGSALVYAAGGTHYQWSPPIGLSSDTAQFVIAAPQSTTTYRVRAFNQFGCEEVDSVSARVFPKTELKVSPNGDVCRGKQLKLEASGGALYQWTPPTGLSCDNCEATEASPEVDTKYSVAATDSFGCKYEDSVSVFVREVPFVSTAPDITICKGESVSLTTDASVVSHVSWYPETHLDNPKSINPVAFPDDSTTYIVSVTNAYGCKNSDSVDVRVIKKVDADVTDANVCKGENVSLEVRVNLASENGYEISWSPAGMFDDIHAPVQNIVPHEDMEISVIVTSQTCEADTAIASVRLHDMPEVEAGNDEIVYAGEKVIFNAFSYSQINEYHWSPAEVLQCSQCQSPVWVADESRKFVVRVVDINGCPAVDSVMYRVLGSCKDDIYVPNAFTPNADEANDRFLVRSQNPISLEYFQIYDRWGKEVYSSTDIEEGWDGTCNSKDVVPGVYVYHLVASCRNGEGAFLKGNVTVIR